MTTKSHKLLRKALFVAGILCIGWTANAQSQAPANTSDSTHRRPMHHQWGPRNGSDSLAHKGWANHRPGEGGFHRGEGGRESHGWAQGGFHRPGDRGFNGRRGQGEGIRYTPEQRKQVMAINKDYRTKAADLYKQDNLTLKQYKAGLVALQKDKKAKLEALITPQQKDQIARRKKMMEENMQVAEAGRMERLKLRLNLTDDQVAKIKAGNASLRDQFKAIHENDNLLPQQKMEQMKDLMAKRKDVFKSVLTPDQYSKFEQMSEHHRGSGHEGFRGPGFGGPGGPGHEGFDGPGA